MVAGMGQMLGQFPVVGHQQQPFGQVIQPPHRVQPLMEPGHQVRHCPPALGILHGGHHPPGLVQQIGVPGAFPVKGFPVHGDPVRLPHPGAQFRHRFPVHLDPSCQDDLFTFPA